MFRQGVCRIVRAGDLVESKPLLGVGLLDPQGLRLDVPELPETTPLGNAQSR